MKKWAKHLRNKLGDLEVGRALSRQAEIVNEARRAGTLFVDRSLGVASTAASGIIVPRNTFLRELSGMNRWQPTPQRVNLARQLFSLRTLGPKGQGEIRRGCLTWLEWLRPSPTGREYLIRLEYTLGNSPSTYVQTPSLSELAGGRSLPHVYSQEHGKLCLYLPGCGQWHASMFLSKTVIAWAILWLYFF